MFLNTKSKDWLTNQLKTLLHAWKDEYGLHLRIYRRTLHITKYAIIFCKSYVLFPGVNCRLGENSDIENNPEDTLFPHIVKL